MEPKNTTSTSTITTTMLSLLQLLLLLFLFSSMHTSIQVQAASPYPQYNNTKQQLELRAKTSSNQSTNIPLSASKKYEGSSELIHLRYHMGPVLSSTINLFLIWYGHWSPSRQAPIRDFLLSISDSGTGSHPTVSQWWGSTAALYADQTGSNVTRRIALAREISFPATPRGTSLTRLTVQQIIADAVTAGSLPIDHRHGVYLVLTSGEIQMQDFCRAVCGFHYFTFPSIVGHTLPYAWVGDSGKQCPEVCAYPFAIPSYMAGATAAMAPPNGDVGVDGMVSVIGHEMAELSTNPLVNAWYAGEDPTAPTEIGDLCEGVYGSGGGGGYTGEVEKDEKGRRWNMKGRNGRRFLVQWLWNPVIKACYGPNAVDQ